MRLVELRHAGLAEKSPRPPDSIPSRASQSLAVPTGNASIAIQQPPVAKRILVFRKRGVYPSYPSRRKRSLTTEIPVRV
jgi:hypothetical protein